MIATQTFEGLSGGMNLDLPGQDLPPNMARYMQDVLVDVPGTVRRRGILKVISGYSASIGYRATGMASTVDVSGVAKIGILAGDNTSSFLHTIPAPFTAAAVTIQLYYDHLKTLAFKFNPASNPYIVDTKPAMGGGTMIGVASQYNAGTTNDAALWYWKGATKADHVTGNNVTATRSSTTVTSTVDLTSNVSVGMFMFDNTATKDYIGVVAAIDFGVTTPAVTTILLEDKALKSISASAANFRSLRGVWNRVARGSLTVASGATAVVGTDTRFKSQGLDGGTWDIFKAADMTYVGTVAAVTSNLNLTLVSGAAIKMTSSDAYMAVKRGVANAYDADLTSNGRKPGFLTAVWGGRQWYANKPVNLSSQTTQDLASRVHFSELIDFEAWDSTKDGNDFLNVVSANQMPGPIVAIAPTANGLAVLKEQELFVIVGTSRSNFTVRKVANVGTIATASVQPYAGGIIFAARNGIFMYDGVRLENLAANLGMEYSESMKAFTTATDRAWAMISRDHYILNISAYAQQYTIYKGASATSPTRQCFIINLRTGALGTLTNFDFRGGIEMPAATGLGTLYVVHTSAPLVKLCDMQYFWNLTGADTVTCNGLTIGPDFFLETRKFDLGDGERKKLFKQIAMQYYLAGDTMGMDTIPGLTNTGTATTNQWQTVSDWTNKRIKFLKRSTHLGLRLYQTSSAVTDFRFGPYAIGYKFQRPGRV